MTAIFIICAVVKTEVPSNQTHGDAYLKQKGPLLYLWYLDMYHVKNVIFLNNKIIP